MRPRTGSGASGDARSARDDSRDAAEEGARGTRTRCAARSRFPRRRIKRAMREARGGMMEWEVEALIDYAFRSSGAAGSQLSVDCRVGPERRDAALHQQ